MMRSVTRTAVVLAFVIGATTACGGDDSTTAPTSTDAAPTTAAPTTDAPTTTVAPTTTAAPTTLPPTTTVAPTTTAPDPANDRVLDDAESEALGALLVERQTAGEPGASDAFQIFTGGGVGQLDMVDEVCGYLVDFPFNGLVSAFTSAGWSEEGVEMYVTELARLTCRDLLPESRR